VPAAHLRSCWEANAAAELAVAERGKKWAGFAPRFVVTLALEGSELSCSCCQSLFSAVGSADHDGGGGDGGCAAEKLPVLVEEA